MRAGEAADRVAAVMRAPGFAALWTFVEREKTTSGDGRFCAIQPGKGAQADLCLDASNYVRDYWNRGRLASYSDFPLLGRGPFGQAIRIAAEPDPDFRPLLQVPRARLHDSAIDVKGANQSVSMLAWVVRESGNHAVAGIWHEGTDLHNAAGAAARVERGRRQYALFAGLAAKNGASAVHVSENGAASFGDKYARNLAVTPEVIPPTPGSRVGAQADELWSVMGFVFDNRKDTVTAYLDGVATEYWIDDPASHPFFQWPAKAWTQAQLRRMPGLQPGEDPEFPEAQFYTPPETKPLWRQTLSENAEERVELQVFRFTKVKVTLTRDAQRRFRVVKSRELAALRANPFWFPHDLFTPPSRDDGGPFTIGRVIHSSRGVGFTGWIGAVAVFNRALDEKQMKRLSAFRTSVMP